VKKKTLFILLFMFLFIPAIVSADQTELSIESYTSSVKVGDSFEVHLLSFNSSCEGSIDTTLKYDSSVLELVDDNISKYTTNKNVISNANGSYSVSYNYDYCDLNEGIPGITVYKFKVKSATVSTTSVSIDSYGTPKTVTVNIEKSAVIDEEQDVEDNNQNASDNDIDENNNTDQNGDDRDNNDFMNYIIVALLSVIALLLLILICVMISRNRKQNR